MVYQSMSGDASGTVGTFTMTGGSLSSVAGPLFYVTNTTAIVSLTGVTLAGAVQGAALTLVATSRWNVTADSSVTALTDPGALAGATVTNISGNGHTVHCDRGLPANRWLGGKTYALAGGARLVPNP